MAFHTLVQQRQSFTIALVPYIPATYYIFCLPQKIGSRLSLYCNCVILLYLSNELVESMGDIIPRTSQLDPGVQLSLHPAPDVLSF